LAFLESFVILGLGFGPPMLILYLIIRHYEENLVWERVFTFAVIGIISGIFIAALHLILEVSAGRELTSLLLIDGILAFIEQGVIMIVFNLPRFQKRWDTPFYAASFGSGVASMIFLIRVYPFATGFEGAIFSFDIFFQSLFFALIFAFLFPSVASIVGFGAFRGGTIRYYLMASMIQWSAFVLVSPALVQDPDNPDTGVILASLIGTFIFSFFVYLIAMGYILPQCSPNKKQRKKE